MVGNLAPDTLLAYGWYEQRNLAPDASFAGVHTLLGLFSVAIVNQKAYHRLRVFPFSSRAHP
jgi:hypothetical protein